MFNLEVEVVFKGFHRKYDSFSAMEHRETLEGHDQPKLESGFIGFRVVQQSQFSGYQFGVWCIRPTITWHKNTLAPASFIIDGSDTACCIYLQHEVLGSCETFRGVRGLNQRCEPESPMVWLGPLGVLFPIIRGRILSGELQRGFKTLMVLLPRNFVSGAHRKDLLMTCEQHSQHEAEPHPIPPPSILPWNRKNPHIIVI